MGKLSFYLCRGDDTVASMLQSINENDPDGIKYTCDEEKDRCYIGDELFRNADKVINYHNTYYAVHAVKD